MKLCPYCRVLCVAGRDVDLHGHCGCCCQWVFCDRLGNYSLVRGLWRIYRCLGVRETWRALAAVLKGSR